MTTEQIPAVQTQFFDLPGVRLHAAVAGTGPLVILLHGFPDFWYGWRHQIGPLAAAGYRVVAPDMRGYHLSDKPDGIAAYRLNQLADDVAALIDALGESSATVVGHDWGGIVAWHTAIRHPERVRRLAILNAPPPLPLLARPVPPDQLLRSWYIYFFQLPGLPEASMRAGDFAFLRQVLRKDAQNPDALSEADMQRYVTAWGQPGALTAEVNYYRALAWHGPWDTASALMRNNGYAGPVLVVWGEGDPHIASALAAPDPKRVPRARVVRVPDAGHWVQWDQPARVNEALLAFLRA